MKYISAYAKFFKGMCTLKKKSNDDKSKKVLLSEQVSTILKFDTLPKFKDLVFLIFHVVLVITKLKGHS